MKQELVMPTFLFVNETYSKALMLSLLFENQIVNNDC